MSDLDVTAIHRRTLATLVVAQAVGGLGITIGVATASLLAREVSGSEGQAGLPQTSQVLGAAAASYLLARVMAQRGRRVGQVTGLAVGAAGAALCVVAGVIGSMLLLLVGALMLGSTTAANAAARYAATDLAPEHTRARSLALVVWATTLGAVVGPDLTGPATELAAWLGIRGAHRAVRTRLDRDGTGRAGGRRGAPARPAARGAGPGRCRHCGAPGHLVGTCCGRVPG